MHSAARGDQGSVWSTRCTALGSPRRSTLRVVDAVHEAAAGSAEPDDPRAFEAM